VPVEDLRGVTEGVGAPGEVVVVVIIERLADKILDVGFHV